MTAPAPNTPAVDPADPPATGEDALGDPGKAALAAIRREKAAAEKQARDLAAELQAIRDKDASASDVANRKASEAETRASAAEQRLARIEAALEAGLDVSLAPRLQGTTADELLADAKLLAKQMPGTPAPPPPAGDKPRERMRRTGDTGGDALPLNGDPLVDSIKAKLGIG